MPLILKIYWLLCCVADWMRRNAGGDGTRPLTGHCHHRHYWARPAPPRLQHPYHRHRRLSHWIICALKIWHPPFPPPTLSISYPVLSTTATFFMFPWFGCSRVPSEEIINFDIKAKIHKIACQWWRSLRTSAQFYVERHCSSAFL